MLKITIDIDGMMCGMCETHINDAIHNNFSVKKVKSSHSKGKTEIITEKSLDEDKLREIIEKTGYTITGIHYESYEKKGLFHR